MSLELYTDKLPAELQEAYKADIAKAVIVSDRDQARKLIAENQNLQAEFQASLSRKHEESLQRFHTEKLPEIIEAEIRKRSTKDPTTLEIEKLRAEIEAEKRNGLLKERKSQAISEFAKLGMSPDLSDFVIDADETVFIDRMNKLTSSLTAWKDAEIKKAGISAFGQKTPTAGQVGNIDFSKMTVTDVMAYAGQSIENKNAVNQWQRSKK